MKYIIIEDEPIAAERLKKLIGVLRPGYECVKELDSVESAIRWLPSSPYDLLFMDIQLADGLSFKIFESINIQTPIIFTTAYDEYALRAFKTNSIDYLLKPIDAEELARALIKFETHHHPGKFDLKAVWDSFHGKGKERFVVKVGDHLKTVETNEILLVFSKEKATFLLNREGKRFLIDYTMDKVEELLDPVQFFRVSRKFIIRLGGLQDIIHFTNSRLELKVAGYSDEQIIVARERVGDFKKWLDR